MNIIDVYLRGFPVINPVIFLFIGLLQKNKFFIKYFVFSLVVDFLGVKPLKWMSEKIYNLLSVEYIPVLGLGRRPIGAVSCGIVNDGKPCISFGMPSGHAMISGFTFMYFYLYINQHFTSAKNKILLKLLLFIVSISVCISRILFGCHTVQQVIIGALIGLVFGYKLYSISL